MIPLLPPLKSYLRQHNYIEEDSSIYLGISPNSEEECVIRVNPQREQSKKIHITETKHPTVYEKIQPIYNWVCNITVPETTESYRVKFRQTGIQTTFYIESSERLQHIFKQLICHGYRVSPVNKYLIHTTQNAPINLHIYTDDFEIQKRTVPYNSTLATTFNRFLQSQFHLVDPQSLTEDIRTFHVKSAPKDSYIGFDVTTRTDYTNCTSCDLLPFFQSLIDD